MAWSKKLILDSSKQISIPENTVHLGQ